MKKLQSIQMLRGIAALGVALFHCLAIENKYFSTAKVLPDLFELGQSGVDLFFVVSGFVMITLTKGRHGLPLETWRFLWSRLTRIYPTYWFYFLLTAGIFFVRPNWVNASQAHQADLLTSFFLLPSEHLPLVMVAWSLIHELWFYLVLAIFISFPERFLPVLLLVWAFAVTAANLVLVIPTLPPSVQIVVHPYSIEFIIGAFAALVCGGVRRVLTKLEFAIALTLILFGLIVVFHSDILRQPSILRATCLGLLYGFTVSAVVMAERSHVFRVPVHLVALGDSSYTVYLSHLLVLSALGRLWSMWFPVVTNPATTAIVFSAMLVTVVIYGSVGYRLVELPALRFSHQLRALWFDGHRRDHAQRLMQDQDRQASHDLNQR